ncbi:hypothetical protein EJ03DRAFT_155568 [Teratosphaeria nubilosa]|uniref:Uncharacterized protein n=1 Tax=Teratosphaeria nubilosa TaxID=161662 RepID=A0A6G1LJQ3_9PEZI|nr:hypothetical protein EJ03DRAFT_155568 [Teratosphaeria nubilosa]
MAFSAKRAARLGIQATKLLMLGMETSLACRAGSRPPFSMEPSILTWQLQFHSPLPLAAPSSAKSASSSRCVGLTPSLSQHGTSINHEASQPCMAKFRPKGCQRTSAAGGLYLPHLLARYSICVSVLANICTRGCHTLLR